MKKMLKHFAVRSWTAVAVGLLCMVSVSKAQEVNTLFFLENAPMRHIVNPAFQPVSDGYVNFTPLGYMSLWGGNNSLTMRDLIYTYNNQTITALHPEGGDRAALLNTFRKATMWNTDLTLDLVSFGFRIKDFGYVHFNVMEKIDAGVAMPQDLFRFMLGGGMTNLTGLNHYSLKQFGIQAQAYTEIAGGYSHKINDEWTVGGKLKILIGQAYVGYRNGDMNIDASPDAWRIYGDGAVTIAGPMRLSELPNRLSYNDFQGKDMKLFSDSWQEYLKPSGGGLAVDLGATYKPHPQVQISLALNDLGFIYWSKGRKYNATIDTTFVGAGEFKYENYVYDGKFQGDSLWSDVKSHLEDFAKGIKTDEYVDGFARMVNMKLNIGVDANFLNNLLGVGIFSRTHLHNGRLYEELTLGGAVRPCNWFNFALSYSLVNNGKFSNIGAGISIMPYDGINMTIAMDYIPTSYVPLEKGGKIAVPYKTKGVNLALGFSIVWGTNKKRDTDKDGILDPLDVCPNTPQNVKVDKLGCPLDSDGDGVPDYLDQCPGTPSAAYGFIDSVGCPLDNDSDGVYDYLDLCPQTLPEARGFVDEHGCDLDSDGDGVPDYRDSCPNTPIEARGFVDQFGCELDTDSDGVYDWRDSCPNTVPEARGFVDEFGCELDTDGDSVPDWKDRCPNTPKEARGFVDEYGCEKDDDGDGVPNWKDECPTVAGPAYNKGCPEVKKEIRNLLKKAMQGIQFENNKAVIKKVSFPLLDKIAQTFIDNKNFIIEVQGHTDNVGKADYNMKLSDARANAVMKYLIDKGVPQERISAKGYGLERPIADNKTKAGRAQNRRVEFDITFEEVKIETELQHIDSALYKQHLQELEQKRLDSIRQDSIKNAQQQPAPQQAEAPQTVTTPAGEAAKQ